MNKSFVLVAVLAAAALTGIFSSTTMVFAQDESETNTEQEIKQKNVGSGESTNNNCALNSIDATGTGQGGATVACPVTSVN
jgi:hypothetical protein